MPLRQLTDDKCISLEKFRVARQSSEALNSKIIPPHNSESTEKKKRMLL